MTIETQQVHWQGRYLLPDTADPGDEPDTLPLEGHVSFSPVWDERISGFLSDAMTSIHVRVFTFELREGKLMSKDDDAWVPGVKIPSRIGGVTLSWVCKFDVHAEGNSVPVRDISFTSDPGGSVSLVDTVPAEAIYPRFSPDVVRGDSVEEVFLNGDYLTFVIGTGSRARQTLVQLPPRLPLAGGTFQRPASPAVGTCYFDTTEGLPVWWDGLRWVDATGLLAPPAQ